jgi:uncharacterized protein (DUF1778 family)
MNDNDAIQIPIGPPKPDDAKAQTYGVKLTVSGDDFHLLSVAAKKAGLTLTDFMLEAAKKRAVRFSSTHDDVETDDPRTKTVRRLEVRGARKFPLRVDASTVWLRYSEDGKKLTVFCHTSYDYGRKVT